MQNRLESKVQSLRSQGLKFEKDGFDFTLDVPDTGDVKSIFGTMVDTIVTQEKQIVTLVDTLEKTNEDFKKSQKEIMNWATQAIYQLNAKNDLLFESLLDARTQIKNFTFNIQGYEDKTEHDDFSSKMKVLNKSKSLAPPIQQEGDPLYFPTEDGAPLKNHLVVSQSPAPSKSSQKKKGSSAALLDKMIENVSRKESIGPPVMTPRLRWQWAIRQTIIRSRIGKLGFSLTRTRVAKSSSVLDRLERIEQRLFYLPMEILDKVGEVEETLGRKMAADLTAHDEKHRASTAQMLELLHSLEVKYNKLHGDVLNLGGKFEELREELKTAVHLEAKHRDDQVSHLQQLRDQDVKLQHSSLRDKLVTLTSAFKTLELGVGKVTKEIDAVIKGNESNYKKGNDETAPVLLKSDTNLKQLREKFTTFESDLFTLHTYASSLRQEASTMLGSHAGELLAQIEDVITEGLGEVELSVEQIKTQLQKHDEVIAERWSTLGNIPKSARDLKTLTEKLENLQTEVDNKVSNTEVHELLKDMIPHPNLEFDNRDVTPSVPPPVALEPPTPTSHSIETTARRGSVTDPQLKEKIDLATSQIKELAQRLETLESIRPSQTPQGARTPIVFQPAPANYSATPRDSSQLQAVSAMISEPMWNQADFETQIQPLIKDIVNMYLATWEESQGYYDQDYYPEDENFQGDEDSQTPHEDGADGPSNLSDSHLNDKRDGPTTAVGGTGAKDPFMKLKDFGSVDMSSPRTDPGERSESPKPTARPRPSSKSQSRTTIRERHKELLDDEIEDDKGTTPRPLSHRRTEAKILPYPAAAASSFSSDDRRPRKTEIAMEKKKEPVDDSHSTANDDKVKKSPGEDQDTASALPAVRSTTDGQSRRLLPANSRSRDFDEHRPRRPMGQLADNSEVIKLKADIKELQEKYDKMEKFMMPKEELKALLNQKADTKLVNSKVDSKVIETIETTVRDCVSEMGDLKQLREEELAKLKAGIEKKIKSSLKALLMANLDEMRSASASLKSLCLSCGQQSPVRVQSSQTSVAPFLPSLHSHSTSGPEVLRGGFRMPVSSQPSTGLLAQGPLVLGSNFSLLSIDESLLSGSDGDNSKSKHSNLSKKLKSVPAHIPSPTYVEESACARALHKKGFPGKKSNRAAAAFAPDRYSLPTDPMSRSAPLLQKN